MKVKLLYEVFIERETQLDCDNLSMGIVELLNDTEGVTDVTLLTEQEIIDTEFV